MPITQTQRAEIVLTRIIESDTSTVEQILEATRQLMAFKRLKPVPRAKRKPKRADSKPLSVLGSK